MDEPNVLFLDEPTNDLDIETLTQLEDLLDGWPGSMIVISHDRFFIERTTDRVFALLGDAALRMLPRGMDEYLERRAAGTASKPARPGAASPRPGGRQLRGEGRARAGEAQGRRAALESTQGAGPARTPPGEARRAGGRAARAARRAPTDYSKLQELDARLKEIQAETARVEEEWLMLAEDIG